MNTTKIARSKGNRCRRSDRPVVNIMPLSAQVSKPRRKRCEVAVRRMQNEAAETVHLALSPRVPLVKMDTVIAARGEHHYTISRRVKDGTLRWVFNVAVDPANAVQNLRFWTREVAEFAAGHFSEHKALRQVDASKVIGEILGQRQKFSTGEVCMLLGVRRNMLMRLREQMLMIGQEKFPRRVVERFLKRRLLS